MTKEQLTELKTVLKSKGLRAAYYRAQRMSQLREAFRVFRACIERDKELSIEVLGLPMPNKAVIVVYGLEPVQICITPDEADRLASGMHHEVTAGSEVTAGTITISVGGQSALISSGGAAVLLTQEDATALAALLMTAAVTARWIEGHRESTRCPRYRYTPSVKGEFEG